MKIKVITGENLFFAGKNLISKIDLTNPDLRHFVVVPDRFSLQAEAQIMQTLNLESTFNIEVLGLTRLVGRVLRQLGFQGKPITNDECLLLTQQAIEDEKQNFKSFKKNSISFTQEVSKVIAQFKSSLLQPENIAPRGCSQAVKNKYEDLARIYARYQQLLGNRMDANKLLELFGQSIVESGVLKNVCLYIVGFDNFTAEMFSVICALARSCSQVNIALAKPASLGNAYIYEEDILNKLEKLCASEGIEIEVEEISSPLLPQQKSIIQGLYSSTPTECKQAEYFVPIACQSATEEIATVGKLIGAYVHRGGRYKDVVVACADLEKTAPVLQSIFDRLELPYFVDLSVKADSLILPQAIFKFLNVVSSGFCKDELLDFFSISFLPVQNKQDLLNTIRQKNINGRAKAAKFLSHFGVLQIFDAALKAKTNADFCEAVKGFVDFVDGEYTQFCQQINVQYIKEGNLNAQAKELTEAALYSINSLQASFETDANEFAKTLKMLLSYKEVSSVPTYVDSVCVADATKSYFVQSKVIFVLAGCNELPQIVQDSGLVSDDDIESVHFIRKLEPSIKVLNRRNRFKLFSLLSLATDRLLVTYRTVNAEGKRIEAPSFVENLQKMFGVGAKKAGMLFSSNDESRDEQFVVGLGSYKNALNLLAGDEGLSPRQKRALESVLKFDLQSLEADREKPISNAQQLFFAKGTTKVTQIENYFSCPFKHFVRYGLKIDEEKTDQLQPKDVGNICHKMAEIYVKQGQYNPFDIDKFVQNHLPRVIKQLKLDEKIENLDDGQLALRQINFQVKTILTKICYETQNSGFKPFLTEHNLQGQTLQIEGQNKTLVLNGKVDRVDKFDQYFRVIDYKTGKINPLVKDLYYGNKLQLFIYQSALQQSLGLAPSGVYYFDCKFDFTDEDSGPVLKGLALNQDDVLQASDLRLGVQEKSDLLSLQLRKDGKGMFKGSAISKTSLLDLQQYAVRVAQKALGEIYRGQILPKPDEEACAYCNFRAICLYNKHKGYRKKSRTDESDIVKALKGGSNE